MEWRPIGTAGERYPAWLRALNGKHGVYAIRRRGLIFTTNLYVGESHTGALYKTLTRHFQRWNRAKGSRDWWRRTAAYRPEQTDPGHTYERTSEIEVAIEVARSREHALELQAAWIEKLDPRDNKEEAPF